MKYLGKIIDNKDLVTKEYVDTGLNGKANSSHTQTVSTIIDLTATATELNYTDGVTSNIQTQLNSKASLASPAFTGIPIAPTAAIATNNTQIATTAFVKSSVPDVSKYVKISDTIDSTPTNPINADTLNGYSASSFIKTSDLINADKLNGYAASSFIKTGDSINATTLNGKNSSEFVLISDIVDNLNTNKSNQSLSANQGMILNTALSDLSSQVSENSSSISSLNTSVSGLNTSVNSKVNISGGTMTGILVANSNTSYTTKQVRNVFLSTSAPSSSDGSNGDIWIVYGS